MILSIFCTLPGWLISLLPFLLGLGLGWALWSKFKSQVAGLESQVSGLQGKVASLDGEVKSSHHTIAELEGEVSIAKGKMREAELSLAEYKTASSNAAKSGSSSDVGGTSHSTSASISGSHTSAAKSQGNETNDHAGKSDSSGGSSSGVSSASGAASASGGAVSGSGSGASSGNTDGHAGKSDSSGGSTLGGSSASGAITDGTSASSFAGNDMGSIDASASGGAGGDATRSGAASGNAFNGLDNSDLQVIEGIGPKMEEVLKENGINSWSELSTKSNADLRAILDKYGDKYKIIDPETWAQQAKLAHNGDFDALVSFQKNVSGGSSDALGETDAKVEKHMVKLGLLKLYKKDDLKAIEGIGPKIEEHLHANGVKTWAALASMSTAEIQAILDTASNFGLADPATWPKQAELADQGKWDELKTYQDFLIGGKG